MKLTELKGKENLPEKTPHTYGRNITIDEYNQLEIEVDTNELLRFIVNGITGEPITYDKLRRIVNDINPNLSKFLVIKKGG